MRKIAIVTDSNSGISQMDAEKIGVFVLPMPFTIDGKEYFEGINLTVDGFYEMLENDADIYTSQPAPEAVTKLWDDILKEYDEIVHIPMSSGLSGACQTAWMLSQEYDGKVQVVDNQRISVTQRQSVLDALELIKRDKSAEEIKNILEADKMNSSIYIMMDTLKYLKKGGRITPATAAIGTVLNIKPILKLNTGVLETYKKSRGMKKARQEMLEAMKHDFDVTFKEYADKGEIYLMAASSADEATTQEWVEEIKAYFPGMEVLCDDLSLGICCHTGEGALGIGCSCRPRR